MFCGCSFAIDTWKPFRSHRIWSVTLFRALLSCVFEAMKKVEKHFHSQNILVSRQFFYVFLHCSFYGLNFLRRYLPFFPFSKQPRQIFHRTASDCQCVCSEGSAFRKIFHRYNKQMWKLPWPCIQGKWFLFLFVDILCLQSISRSCFWDQGGSWHAAHKTALLGKSLRRCSRQSFACFGHQWPSPNMHCIQLCK